MVVDPLQTGCADDITTANQNKCFGRQCDRVAISEQCIKTDLGGKLIDGAQNFDLPLNSLYEALQSVKHLPFS